VFYHQARRGGVGRFTRRLEDGTSVEVVIWLK
jgi:hypothetical protein